ncbi:hypothetical protein H6P81_004831 [Aristolochia fimbriata]|uniref:DUF7028 domain-containing protein n=1 Tax=Aristolochia fimbriata TaxID=158543 RepID=A0AAV7ESV2_ARIFI|nr:hypothetical protein H6P81_004831 [Aristolochia fimbriata]
MRERRKPGKVRIRSSNTDECGKDGNDEIVSGHLGRIYSTSQASKRRKTSKVQFGRSDTDEDGQAHVPLSNFSPEPRVFGGIPASSYSTEDLVGLHEEDLFYELWYDFEDAEYSNSLAAVGIGEEKEVREPTLGCSFDTNAIASEILPQFHLLHALEPCSDSLSLEDLIQTKDDILGFDSHDSSSNLELSSSVVASYSGLSDPKDATSVPKDICCSSDVEDYGVWDIIHQMIDGGTTNEFLTLMNEFQCNNREMITCFAICASGVFKPAQKRIMEDDCYSEDVLLEMTEFSSNEKGVMPCSADSSSNNGPSDASKASMRGISGQASSLKVAVVVDAKNSISASGELCLSRSRSGTAEVKEQHDPATCGSSKLQGSVVQRETKKRKFVGDNRISKQRTLPRKANVFTPHHSESVDITSKFCPKAVTDYCNLEEKKKVRDSSPKDVKPTTLRLNAKRHLLAVGWKLWYCPKGGKRELRYTSPQGKCYYSLLTACYAWMEQGVQPRRPTLLFYRTPISVPPGSTRGLRQDC